jgi:hypothetical protein
MALASSSFAELVTTYHSNDNFALAHCLSWSSPGPAHGGDAARVLRWRLDSPTANSKTPSRDWWFASTAIPLLAATIGPLSNVLSIAALASPWKVTLPKNGILPEGADDNGVGIKDPTWELALNACSLACGFAGNILLLLHFTGRVRYIVALPLSITFWILASGIVGDVFGGLSASSVVLL